MGQPLSVAYISVLVSALSIHEIKNRALDTRANSFRHFRAAKNVLKTPKGHLSLPYYTIFIKNAKKEKEHDAPLKEKTSTKTQMIIRELGDACNLTGDQKTKALI